MKLNSNTLSLIIGAIVVAGGIWYFFFSGGSGNEQPVSAQGAANPAQTQFAALVSQLQPITFTTGIFEDPDFMALVDLSTPVTPESAGRLDPFAPLP